MSLRAEDAFARRQVMALGGKLAHLADKAGIHQSAEVAANPV